MAAPVRISFLGGLGEIGRNCASLEVDGEIALIDCGLMFPEEDMLGVDLVLPDFSWIVDRADDVECVVTMAGSSFTNAQLDTIAETPGWAEGTNG